MSLNEWSISTIKIALLSLVRESVDRSIRSLARLRCACPSGEPADMQPWACRSTVQHTQRHMKRPRTTINHFAFVTLRSV